LVELERTVSKKMEELREQNFNRMHKIDMLEKDLKRSSESVTSLQKRLEEALVRANHFEKEDSAKHLAIVEYKALLENGKVQLQERDALIKNLREKAKEMELHSEVIHQEQLALSAKVALAHEEKAKLVLSEEQKTKLLDKTEAELKSVREELFYEKRLGADRQIAQKRLSTTRVDANSGGSADQECAQQ